MTNQNTNPGESAPGAVATTGLVAWALYDCDDLVSHHTTERGAAEARQAHLDSLRQLVTELGGEELFTNVVTIRAIKAHDN